MVLHLSMYDTQWILLLPLYHIANRIRRKYISWKYELQKIYIENV